VVIDRSDIDTDQIVPKQFLKRIDRTGYGEVLFHDWCQDPGFELNEPNAASAKILLTGPNFGCGSSREHAAWALQDFGFEVIIAPSYGDIFFTNAVQIGLVPISIHTEEVKSLMRAAADGLALTVDLKQQTIGHSGRTVTRFEIDPFVQECLLKGLDPIAITQEHDTLISAYENARPSPISTARLA